MAALFKRNRYLATDIVNVYGDVIFRSTYSDMVILVVPSESRPTAAARTVKSKI